MRNVYFFYPALSHVSWAVDMYLKAIRYAVGIVVDKSLTAIIICILSSHISSKEWYHFSYHVHGSIQGKELISGSLLFWTLREI